MRSLRVLAHLVVALALVMASAAQARVVGEMPMATTQDHAHHAGAAVALVSDCHGMPADEAPTSHDPSDCRTACCFAPGQISVRAPGVTAVDFLLVRYAVAAQALSGRAFAPDPEIPKRDA